MKKPIIIPLPDICDTEESKVKFVFLENETLLFGKCMYHKDLMEAYFKDEEEKYAIMVIGAGVLPHDVHVPVDDDSWGEWRSSGYGVVTSIHLRPVIQEAFIMFFTSSDSQE